MSEVARAFLNIADEIERTRSTKGIAVRALDPGKAYAVDFLRDRARELLAGGHGQAGLTAPGSDHERLGVPPASAPRPTTTERPTAEAVGSEGEVRP